MDLASCRYEVEVLGVFNFHCPIQYGGLLSGGGGRSWTAMVLDIANDWRGFQLVIVSHGNSVLWLYVQAATPSLDVPVMEAHLG